MIIATLSALLLFFGGGVLGDSDEQMVALMKDAAAECIADPGRREEAQQVLDRMQREVADYEFQLFGQRRRLLNVDRDYDATPEDYRVVVRHMHAVWLGTERRLIDLRFQLRDLMTRDEWYAMMGGVETP